MTATVNSRDEDVAQVAAALADACHAGGLSDGYYRKADDALGRLRDRLEYERAAKVTFQTQALTVGASLKSQRDRYLAELRRMAEHVDECGKCGDCDYSMHRFDQYAEEPP